MSSSKHGRRTLTAEITNVSQHGFWIQLDDRELFAAFDAFPWFRNATIAELTKVERPSSEHLHWPALDIDLTVDSLTHPDRYPLVGRSDRPAVVRDRADQPKEEPTA
ncbi:MAG TPA: DUF2442 domain-containing protein [Gemmatimonadales bacterium]|nr:DUF2442 domain-containing protein [Gemmatimonadales bacterium]